MRIKELLTAGALALTVVAPVTAQQAAEKTPAFPGAEGFGRYVTGGRGGAVYHVTRLDDDNNEGSFRWACSQKGKRTIVFDVSGTIMLKSQLKMNEGNVTIAGQTAPGDGICIANYPFQISADNVIIRYMRFRLGNEALKTKKDAHEGDGLGGMDRKNIIVDHCSVSWSIDECLSVYGSSNITVQWCYVTHSLVNAGHSKGNHGYGGNWGGSGASYHHNLVAHHTSRTPRFGPRPGTQTDERMDYRNNVIYNYGKGGCYGGEGMNVNVVNNYYKPGPGSEQCGSAMYRLAAPGIRTVDYCIEKNKTIANYNTLKGTSLKKDDISGSSDYGKTNYVTISGNKYEINMEKNTIDVDGNTVNIVWNDWKKMLHTWGKLYVNGNYNPKSENMNKDNFKYGVSEQIAKSGTDSKNNDGTYPGDDKIKLSSPIDFVYVTTHTAEQAFDKVIEYAGASKSRDSYDKVIANDVREGKATYGKNTGFIDSQDECGGWPELKDTGAKTDTDGDGMPDEWETANGLNPNDASDGKTVCEDGYTNLEHYMNGLVADITEAQNAGGKTEGYVINTDGSTTGIKAITTVNGDSASNDRIYNLQGVEVKNPGKGIYIRNGKKFVNVQK